ncbi:hypothetical protein ACTA71_007202 [Dictyostelium dimigraforme]
MGNANQLVLIRCQSFYGNICNKYQTFIVQDQFNKLVSLEFSQPETLNLNGLYTIKRSVEIQSITINNSDDNFHTMFHFQFSFQRIKSLTPFNLIVVPLMFLWFISKFTINFLGEKLYKFKSTFFTL